MKFLARKVLGSLRPVDEAGEDALRKIGNGQTVMVEVNRPRNIRHHRRYWALLTLVWENMDHKDFPSIDDFHAAMKIAAGLRTRIELPDGTVGFIPGSIAFHRMSEDDFAAFFDRICRLVATHFLPGVTERQLREELEHILGIAA